MNPEKQRKAIAELCGWTKVNGYEDNAGPPILSGNPPSTYKKRQRYDSSVPDYLNDLNACADIRKSLSIDQKISYVRNLCRLISVQSSDFAFINATALQHCEAFLRTMGGWEE